MVDCEQQNNANDNIDDNEDPHVSDVEYDDEDDRDFMEEEDSNECLEEDGEFITFKCEIDVSVKTLNPEDKQSITISIDFLEEEISRQYVYLDGFRERLLAEEKIVFWLNKRNMEIPTCYFDRECAQRFQVMVMKNMRVPSSVRDQVLKEVESAVKPLLQETQSRSARSLLVSVDIKLVINEEMELINESWIEDLFERRGIPMPIYRPVPRTIFPPIPTSWRDDQSNLDRLTRQMFLKELFKGLYCSNCIVCMEEFDDGDDVVQLPCSHLYHDKCIQKWFKSSQLCPLCRYQMPMDS